MCIYAFIAAQSRQETRGYQIIFADYHPPPLISGSRSPAKIIAACFNKTVITARRFFFVSPRGQLLCTSVWPSEREYVIKNNNNAAEWRRWSTKGRLGYVRDNYSNIWAGCAHVALTWSHPRAPRRLWPCTSDRVEFTLQRKLAHSLNRACAVRVLVASCRRIFWRWMLFFSLPAILCACRSRLHWK